MSAREDIYQFGYEAFHQGKDIADNPFQPGTPEHESWSEGWNQADFEIDWEG